MRLRLHDDDQLRAGPAGELRRLPVLVNVSEQPVTALKDAVDVFLSYLQAHSTDDR